MTSVVDITSVGISALCGGIKGYSEGSGIPLDTMVNNALPVMGMIVPPVLRAAVNAEKMTVGYIIGNSLVYGGLTAVTYVIGRGLGNLHRS